MGALNNAEVGKYCNEYFVSSYQKVATFKIVGNQKQGGKMFGKIVRNEPSPAQPPTPQPEPPPQQKQPPE